MNRSCDVLICGAGVAGISAAYYLAVEQGIQDIILVDRHAPLSLTSDESTECYRNWWPGPGDSMVSLMNRSIDLMESLGRSSGNIIHLNRRGYLYCTGDRSKIAEFHNSAQEISKLGAGPLRVHSGKPGDPEYDPAPDEGFENQPTGADLILDQVLIHRHFPYLTSDTLAVLHVRRAGWLSAQQLGMTLLEKARDQGVQFLNGSVCGVGLNAGSISEIRLESGETIKTSKFVNAAGPFIKDICHLMDIDLPVYNELHLRLAMKDPLEILDRCAPLVIWDDAQRLDWSEEERQILAEDSQTSHLLDMLPAGVHTRPEGPPEGKIILVIWEYHSQKLHPVWPIPVDPIYADIALRGLANMIPGMKAYLERTPRPSVSGGYYTRTQENRPLIGELPVEGAFLIGGLSGFGIMAACAAGELVAAHVAGSPLPYYAPAFSLERYQDQEYQRLLENWDSTGQL